MEADPIKFEDQGTQRARGLVSLEAKFLKERRIFLYNNGTASEGKA
jgi:hypothetical protein